MSTLPQQSEPPNLHSLSPCPPASTAQFSIYTVFVFMGIAAIWRESWLLDTRQLWQGWPDHEYT